MRSALTVKKVIESIKHDCPYMAKYIELYGLDECISTFEKPPKWETMEAFYQYCIENNKKAREIVKPIPDGCLL